MISKEKHMTKKGHKTPSIKGIVPKPALTLAQRIEKEYAELSRQVKAKR